MYWRREMIEVNGVLFQIVRKFKIEDFQKIVDNFPAEEICQGYHSDKLLKGGDGFYYLVNEIQEAEIL